MAEPLSVEPAAPVPASAGARALRRIASAFTYRDFRILWLGAFVSTIGTWMQKVAQSWLILTLTGSAFYLGLDQFLGEMPILLFTLLAGVIADRHDRRHLLIGSQCVQMTCAALLAWLVFRDAGLAHVDLPASAFGRLQIWHVLLLSFVAGSGQAFGGPAYQSLLPSLVDRKDLPNAIAFNSIQFNLARVVGPVIAGIALTWGFTVCFGLNTVSFLVVIMAILALHVRHVPPEVRHSLMHELRGGLRYVRSQRPLMLLTLLAFLTTFLSLALPTFLPIFAQRVFDGDVGLYSRMMSFFGAGAVAGALVVAWLGQFRHMGRALLLVQAGFGLVVVAFAMSSVVWVSYGLLFLAGAALMMVFSLITSLVQLTAPNELRGRVMSIYMMAFRGGGPLGGLVSGYAATLFTAPVVLAVNGCLIVLIGLWFLARSRSLREL